MYLTLCYIGLSAIKMMFVKIILAVCMYVGIVVPSVRLYNMLDTVVISGEEVCSRVVFVTLVGVSVFTVIWSEPRMNRLLVVICGHQCTSVRELSVRSHLR